MCYAWLHQSKPVTGTSRQFLNNATCDLLRLSFQFFTPVEFMYISSEYDFEDSLKLPLHVLSKILEGVVDRLENSFFLGLFINFSVSKPDLAH